MKKLIISAAMLLLVQLLCTANASTILDPTAIGVGARPMGMGRAFTAVADDASSIFLNPAGLWNIKTFNLSTMRAALIGDVTYTVAAGAVPMPLGGMGVGYVNSSIAGIPLTRWDTIAGVPRPVTYSYTDFSSNVLLLSYGAPLYFISEKLRGVSAGASLKFFNQYFSETSGSMDGATGNGMDLDIGLKAKTNDWLDLGLFLSNVLPENLGGKFTWRKNAVTEGIPAALKAGAAVKLFGEKGLRKWGSVEATWAIDAEKNLNLNPQLLLWHSAVELWPSKFLALRAGLDQQAGSSNNSVVAETNMTFGVGIKVAPFTFDYAYHRYGDLSENTTHYFSIGYSQDIKRITLPRMPVIKPSAPATTEALPKPGT